MDHGGRIPVALEQVVVQTFWYGFLQDTVAGCSIPKGIRAEPGGYNREDQSVSPVQSRRGCFIQTSSSVDHGGSRWITVDHGGFALSQVAIDFYSGRSDFYPGRRQVEI